MPPIAKKILPTLKRYGVLRAALFGSVARGEATKISDIDVLVQFPPGTTLLDFIDLKTALEKELNKKVDLVTYGSLHPALKDRILADAQLIYEKRS